MPGAAPPITPPPTTTTPTAMRVSVRDDVRTGMPACLHVLPHACLLSTSGRGSQEGGDNRARRPGWGRQLSVPLSPSLPLGPALSPSHPLTICPPAPPPPPTPPPPPPPPPPRPLPPLRSLTHLSAHLTCLGATHPRPPMHPTCPPARASYTNPAPQRTGLAISRTRPPPSPRWLHPHHLPASLSTIVIHVTLLHMPARFLHAPPMSGTLAPLTYPSFPTWPAHPLTCPAPSPTHQWMGWTRRSHSLPGCPTHIQRMPSRLTHMMDVSGP